MAGYVGKQGRKPKASTIIERQRDLGREGEALQRMPTAPKHLTKEERAEWRRVGKDLVEAGLITRLDLGVLEAYCKAYVRWVEAEDKVRQFGTIMKSPNGYPMQSPYLSVANTAMSQMRSLMGDLGLTPAARTRIPRAPVAAETRPEPRKRKQASGGDGVDPRAILRAVK